MYIHVCISISLGFELCFQSTQMANDDYVRLDKNMLTTDSIL